MRKVFAFIGSPLKKASNTYTITKILLDRLVELDKSTEYDILTSGHVRIDQCRGCWNCMTRGFCPLDEYDDMGMIREKMLRADFIILGSPVYIMHISGQMKIFIDRLCAWFHLIRLAGKPGLTVATTASQGLETVHEYIGMVLSTLGVIVVGNLDTYGYFRKLRDPEEAWRKAEKTAELILPYVTGEKLPESNELMEGCFQAMKSKVTYGAKGLPADYEYWKRKGMLELNTFAELLDRVRDTEWGTDE